MSKTFAVTYANGTVEEMQFELETPEEVSNQLFGMSLEEAEEIGCAIALVGDYEPEPADLTGTINAFTQGNPTVVTTDVEDQTILTAGMMIELEPLEGDEAAGDYINGKIVEVLGVSPFITLDLDLSAYNVTGLRADYIIMVPAEAEAAAESAEPELNLKQATEKPVITGGWVPSA